MAQESDTPFRIIKENPGIFGDYLLSNFNDAIDESYFLTAIKQVGITPVFMTVERHSKDNDWTVSIMPNVWKFFEKHMFRQMSNYMENFLSNYQSGFRK